MSISAIKLFFARRKIEKQARHLLKGARHVVNLRGDIARPEDARRLADSARTLADALAQKTWPAIEPAAREVAEAIHKLNPPRPYAALRENIEVLVVALAVAMAFRTYFIQPFKIPTSSMYPTLAGIHYIARADKDLTDYFPVNLVKWAVFGQKFTEVRAEASGRVNIVPQKENPFISVGGIAHKIFPEMTIHVEQDTTVIRRQLLATGIKVAGDHIFVNKVAWNFRQPRRGEIMVFKTDGIRHPQIKPNEHYVKRMVGLPGETLGIVTPNLYINGQIERGNAMIAEIQTCANGYNGYIQAGNFLLEHGNTVSLSSSQYFACGDNQRNSLDSRYWGPVPRANLVGPAFLVYWPLSANWGLVW